MSENLKTELLSQGVDYATALERFMGKEELYKRFLVKFLADDNFNQLEANIGCAHTIKGLCGNLGFDNLLEEDSQIVEILRSGSMDGVEELFETLSTKYHKLCETIKKYE